MLFENRREAGRLLAKKLTHYADRPDVLVLALPRGGVPVAFEVAQALHAPLDVFIVRKLGMPGQEEFAIGAIATGGVRVLNDEIVNALPITPELIDQIAAEEEAELKRRETAYRDDRPPLQVRDRVVILIDDGLATGSTMRAAAQAVRAQHPAWLVIAVPVGAAETCAAMEQEADEVVCLQTPSPFYAVGQWYEDFSQTTDDEVREYLQVPLAA